MEKKEFNYVIHKLFEHAKEHEKHITSEELDESWRRVKERAYVEKRKSVRRCILYVGTASSVAIIFCCMLWLGWQFTTRYTDNDSIANFVEQMHGEDFDGKDILLLIPGKKEKEVKVEGIDANIIYSPNGTITINSDIIKQVETQKKEMEFNQLVVPKGKRIRLTLSDSTCLWVNSGTRVIYPEHFKKNHREIYVEGEVYLDVFRNEQAPFVVRSKDFQVQVLGTSFNVSAYPSEHISSVVLVEGKVKISNQQKEQVNLVPGQLVNIQPGQLHVPQNVNIESYVCWVKNMLMYADEPLNKVFKKLNLYYGKEFVLEPGVAELQVSGKLDLKEKLEDVLHTISFSTPIYYEEIEDKIYVRKE